MQINYVRTLLELNFIGDFANVNFLFSNFRQILEKDNKFDNYPKIKFFSNWLLHHEITRKNSAEAILMEMRKAIIDHIDNKSNINKSLSKAIDLPGLRSEICGLLKENNIDNSKFRIDEYWNVLEINLLKLLLQKSVYFLGLPVLETEKVIPYSFQGFKLISHEGTICWEIISSGLADKDSRIVVQLANPSSP